MNIKLTGTKKDKINGFYKLMTNFTLTSHKLHHFIIHEDSYLTKERIRKFLKKNKVKYQEEN